MSEVIANEFYPIDIGSLPHSWASSSVGSVIPDVQAGFPCGAHHREVEGVPHLRPMNISREGDLDLSDLKYVSADVNLLRASAGDVLFNNTNSPELIGKTAIIPESAPRELAFSNHMTRLRPPTGINSRFAAYQLHFLWMSGYFRHRCTHHVNQASLSSSALASSVPLVIAPTREQNLVVDEIEKQFTRLDAATAALKRVQANLKRYRASVLKAACEGRLVPTEAELARKEGRDYEPAEKLLQRILRERRVRWEADTLAKMQASGKPPKDDHWKQKYKEPSAPDTTNLPELPEGWCWTSLDQLSFIQGGITKGQKRTTEELRSVPYLRVANVQRGYLDLSEVKEIQATDEEIDQLKLHDGDVLFNEGGDRDKLGRGWIWEEQLPLCIHQNHVFRARMALPEIEPRFVSFYANAFGQQYFFDEGKHTTNLASLSMTNLRALPIPLPPAAEQARIVQFLASIIDEVERQHSILSKANAKATSLRSSVLASAFTGQLVSQDPTDEPASALLERIRVEQLEQLPRRVRGKQRSKAPAVEVG